MRKKAIAITLALLAIIGGGIFSVTVKNQNKTNKPVTNKEAVRITANSTVWKEVTIKEEMYLAAASMEKFDLKETIINSDYVFSGAVINRKEYTVEWTDDNGEQWGPFPSSVIEVKVDKEYHGKSPVENDIIKIYYPYSLSTVFSGSFLIKDSGNYIFITRTLDKEFVEQKKEDAPDDKFEQEKHADVFISSPCYSLLPIDNGMVFMYHNYFDWDKNVIEQANYSVKTDKLSSPELVEIGWFLALDINNFDDAFLKLFENPEALPTAEDLHKMNTR